MNGPRKAATFRTTAVLTSAGLLLAGMLAGCAPKEDAQKLVIWSWDKNIKTSADAYVKEHPGTNIEVVNAGTSGEEYVKLQNAVSAGKGFPDLVFLESFAMPQFALSGALADLGPLGADKMASTYAPGPWASSKVNDKVYSLPTASGPMVMFYNKAVFDKFGVAVPTTWDEYVTAAEAIHKADPSVYILNDVGNAGLAESLIWQAGGTPFAVNGNTVSIDLADKGTSRYTKVWQQLIDKKLLAPVADWTDDWLKMLNADKIATLPAGSWMGGTLESSVPKGAGHWRVAQLPQWTAGSSTAAEHGGGGLAVLEKSTNKALAFDFAKYVTTGAGVDLTRSSGLWPSSLKAVQDDTFLDEKSDYFGGQAVNREFAKASSNVPKDFQFLPFQVYANGIFNDTVGKAYEQQATLAGGYAQWEQSLRDYGKQQGFTIK